MRCVWWSLVRCSVDNKNVAIRWMRLVTECHIASLSLSECMCVLNVIAPDVHLYTRYSLHIRDDRNLLVSRHGFSEGFSCFGHGLSFYEYFSRSLQELWTGKVPNESTKRNVCSTIWPSLHSSYVAVDTFCDLTTTTTMMMTWHTISLFIICVRKKSIQSTPRLPR